MSSASDQLKIDTHCTMDDSLDRTPVNLSPTASALGLPVLHLQPTNTTFTNNATLNVISHDQPSRPLDDFRRRFRKPLAEFTGTMILLIFGAAVDCQATLGSNRSIAGAEKGSFLSVCMGWGAGAAFGIWSSASISGGHINPAVTLVHVLFRGFPLTEFFQYVIAQTAGAFTGSLLVYGMYNQAINVQEGGSAIRTTPGTASLFVTFPLDFMNAATCFFSEFLVTAMLLFIVLTVTDRRNAMAPPSTLVPLIIFVAVVALTACFALQTGAAMNPARDFGPRLMTAMFYGRNVFTYRNHYWLWTPIIGDFLGAIAGAFFYDLLIYTGDDSPITKFISKCLDRRPTRNVDAQLKVANDVDQKV
ncbi:hypothetical protein FS837_000562 [Tulasnella sp. UAMH 9824]|nr:hypothetical protein FS837_000562 [Tulasnella sp. UAMH 9824]